MRRSWPTSCARVCRCDSWIEGGVRSPETASSRRDRAAISLFMFGFGALARDSQAKVQGVSQSDPAPVLAPLPPPRPSRLAPQADSTANGNLLEQRVPA